MYCVRLYLQFRFRWVFCQFEFLRHCLPQRIRHALGELPRSLDATYERVLQDINEENWKFASRLFQCVAVASPPLRVEELAEFLAFDFDEGPTPTFQAGWRPADPIGAVFSMCSSLLAVVKVNGLTYIQFSHFSVKEFLTSTRLAGADINISRYHVSMTQAHTVMAQACLGILLHFDETITYGGLRGFPLAEYAVKNWADHVRFDNVAAKTQDGMKRLFDPRRPHLKILVWIYDPEIPWLIQTERLTQSRLRGTCLHYAIVLLGSPDFVKFLLTEFTLDLNARCFMDAVTPLHLASRDGHVEVARVLLEHGADVNARDISNWTSIRYAVNKGRVEVVRVLIENGADVGAQGEDNWMPLQWASRHGQPKLVQVLLEHGVDASARCPGETSFTPLHWASERGYVEVVRVLLKHGADASAQAKNNFTPLHWASKRGDVEVARVLLEHGADASAQDMNGSTPLHVALQCLCSTTSNNHFSYWRTSSFEYLEVAQVLLEHGADLNIKLTQLQRGRIAKIPGITQSLLSHLST